MSRRGDERVDEALKRFVEAEEPEEVAAAADVLAEAWGQSRHRILGALPPLAGLPDERSFRDALLERRREGVEGLREEVGARLVAIERAAAEAERPGGWAQRWQIGGPRLDDAEVQRRLQVVREATGKRARTTAEAVRRVLAARRAQGVGLYATFSTTVRDRYLLSVTRGNLGLVPIGPGRPSLPPSGRTPWGSFKVVSSATPKDARALFRAFPPFPSCSDLLAGRARWPALGRAGDEDRRDDD